MCGETKLDFVGFESSVLSFVRFFPAHSLVLHVHSNDCNNHQNYCNHYSHLNDYNDDHHHVFDFDYYDYSHHQKNIYNYHSNYYDDNYNDNCYRRRFGARPLHQDHERVD